MKSLCKFILCFYCIFLFSALALGTETSRSKEKSQIESFHNSLSSHIERISSKLDYFFSNEQVWAENNRSYLLLNQKTSVGLTDEYKINLRAHLSLPKTQKRVHLFIESPREESEDLAGLDGNEVIKDKGGTNLGTHLRLLGDSQSNFNINSKFGVKAHSLQLAKYDPYSNLRVRYRHHINNNSLLEGHLTPSYYIQAKRSLLTGIHYDYSYNPFWLLRISTNSFYLSSEKTTNWITGLGTFYSLSKDKVIATSFGINSTDSGGTHFSGYSASLGYRQNLLWPWLHIQGLSQWIFPKNFHYRRQYQFALSLQARFGYI